MICLEKGPLSMKWLKIFLALLIVAGGAVGGYAFYLYKSIEKTADRMYQPVTGETEAKEIIEKEKPFCILIMGVDERKGDRGRSDTMMVMAVNPRKESALLFNIPRDTRTEIVGRGTQDKINHAYAYGGVKMSIETVEQFLDVPVDYYAKVNMQGFARIVDALGGVEVDNPFAFQYGGHTFEKGRIHLDGDTALKYARMRYEDPRGDLGRNERQRQVLKSMIKKAASPGIVANLGTILESLGSSVTTNITFDEMKKLGDDYRNAIRKVDTLEIKGRGQKINGIYYLIVSEEEKKRIRSLVKKQLELE
ncbi:LytR family transcriptional attenuator [Planifilum fimeticola]|jgi:polyisoprenyl-teichoic acid--peptidoglycan teichoic acid transferase|uniref:LytR family transcriptional attenuator n=2 Tax=Planifilum fimeticola TaxID=201975 RepID=A0A2T0LEI7_9BACL|nr:LytR family transcriptional attenuator [Planifilum fimeticola]